MKLPNCHLSKKQVQEIIKEYPQLGEGNFGIVYGPFVSSSVHSIMQRFYPEKTPRMELNLDDLYILKINHGRKSYTKTEYLSRCILTLDEKLRNQFLIILYFGKFDFGSFEIQKYGGTELFYIIHRFNAPLSNAEKLRLSSNQRKTHQQMEKLSADPMFRSYWQSDYTRDPNHILKIILGSFLLLIQGCQQLYEKYNILITDIKPENMVMNLTQINKGVCLIDLEYLIVSKTKNPIYTLDKKLIPIQFCNQIYFQDYASKYSKYKNSLGSFSQRLEEQMHFQNIFNDNYQITKDTIDKISVFSIYYVFMHIYKDILVENYPKRQKKHQFVLIRDFEAIFDELLLERWASDFDHLYQQLESFCQTKFGFKKPKSQTIQAIYPLDAFYL